MSIKTVSVPCPQCSKKVLMTDAFPHRPFCSHRCQQIDFGAWASEDYQIEGKENSNDLWPDGDVT